MPEPLEARRLRPKWVSIGRLGPPVVAGVVIAIGLMLAVWTLGIVLPSGPREGHWDAVARGRKHLARGRPDLALRAVADVRDERPGAGEAMTVVGLSLTQLNELGKARLALERALKLQPNQAEAAKVLAAIYLSASDSDRGLALLRKASRLDPNDFHPWLAMGEVYHHLGESEEAADAFAEAIRRAPSELQAQVGRIRELLALNRPDLATPALTDALRHWPDDPGLLGLAARHALDSGRSEEASAFAERALARDPDNLDALLVRAKTQLFSGHPESALVILERAVAGNPNDLATLHMLAQVEAKLGRAARAALTVARHRRASDRVVRMHQLSREISRRPDDPEPRWRLGQVAVEGELTVLAAQSFQAALDLDPRCKPARDGLVSLRAHASHPASPSRLNSPTQRGK